MKKNIWIFGFIGLILLIIILSWASYNSLVDAEEEINRTESEVINRLNERQDKISQLIPTVTGLQEHAEDIYDKITQARKAYNDAQAANDLVGMIEADLLQVESVNQLLVVIEDNPNIHATAAFIGLMDEISAGESALAQARRDYNNSVSDYNRSVRKFPKLIYASIFGFEKNKPYWKMNDGANEIPKIEFNK